MKTKNVFLKFPKVPDPVLYSGFKESPKCFGKSAKYRCFRCSNCLESLVNKFYKELYGKTKMKTKTYS